MHARSRGMLCRSWRMPSQRRSAGDAARRRSATASACSWPISISSGRRAPGTRGADDRRSARMSREAVLAGDQRQRAARLAHFGRQARVLARRSRTADSTTMRSNGPSSAVEIRASTKRDASATPWRAAFARATSSAAARDVGRDHARARQLRGQRDGDAAAAGADVDDRRGRAAVAGKRASASSTMNSVSGRGISTAGVTVEVAAPELLHAADVGDRLAARRGARSSGVVARRRTPAAASSSSRETAWRDPSRGRAAPAVGVERRLRRGRCRPRTQPRARGGDDRLANASLRSPVDRRFLELLGCVVRRQARRSARRGCRRARRAAGGS